MPLIVPMTAPQLLTEAEKAAIADEALRLFNQHAAELRVRVAPPLTPCLRGLPSVQSPSLGTSSSPL